jgi:hypothetical protein
MTAEAIVSAAKTLALSATSISELEEAQWSSDFSVNVPCRQQPIVCLRCDFGPPSVLSLRTLIHIRDDELCYFRVLT